MVSLMVIHVKDQPSGRLASMCPKSAALCAELRRARMQVSLILRISRSTVSDRIRLTTLEKSGVGRIADYGDFSIFKASVNMAT